MRRVWGDAITDSSSKIMAHVSQTRIMALTSYPEAIRNGRRGLSGDARGRA